MPETTATRYGSTQQETYGKMNENGTLQWNGFNWVLPFGDKEEVARLSEKFGLDAIKRTQGAPNFMRDIIGLSNRYRNQATNPASTPLFSSMSAAIRDAGSAARSASFDAIAQSMGSAGGPGLSSGAAAKARIGASGDIGRTVVGAETDALKGISQQGAQSMNALMQTLAQYQASLVASAAGVQAAGTSNRSGAQDFADIARAGQDIWNLGKGFGLWGTDPAVGETGGGSGEYINYGTDFGPVG